MSEVGVAPRAAEGGEGENSVATAVAILRQRFGERVATSQALREQHANSVTYLPAQLPDAVFFAQSTEDVQEAVRICAHYKVPVIPFGTGTSLEGGVNAPQGGISIDVMQMNEVIAVNTEDLDCVVQPGVTREQLNEHLRATGLFFPIDPGANASLGGMASTRASGTNAVRYGTMREAVINVTAVLANGEIIKTANRAKKSSAGYDLTRLFVGSEGTLGIITELTLKLHGIPEAIAAAVCSFPSLEAACNATIMATQMGIPVARIELIDEVSVEAINAYSKTDIAVSPLLLLEFHGSESGVREQSQMFGDIASECGGTGFKWVTEPEERNKLWAARHNAYWAIRAYTTASNALSTDVCVPISRLAECVEETRMDIESEGLFGPIVGHVGDGNFHCLLCFEPDDAETVAKVEKVTKRMAERAIAMDGTCTGEHGIGQGKRKYMEMEHGGAVDAMRAIKQALDPNGIMNPGKVV